MAYYQHCFCCAALTFFLLCSYVVERSSAAPTSTSTSSFSDHFVVSWAPKNVKFLGAHSEALQLSLDEATDDADHEAPYTWLGVVGAARKPAASLLHLATSAEAHDVVVTHKVAITVRDGSGFSSKASYLFGNIDMQIKLVPGDSAGTVTAYYLSSEGSKHDELDFEFLGNSSGQPYVLQTNVFSTGVGGREQRIMLWFDPTKDFHTYSVAWSPKRVVFLVDGVPIRVFSNIEKTTGVPYLSRQPMRVFSSIWNGDSWATRGGLVKIDWAHAPFVATYRNFRANNACIASTSAAAAACIRSAAAASNHVSAGGAAAPGFDRSKLQWVKKNFMVYDYCTDSARYRPAPAECTREF